MYGSSYSTGDGHQPAVVMVAAALPLWLEGPLPRVASQLPWLRHPRPRDKPLGLYLLQQTGFALLPQRAAAAGYHGGHGAVRVVVVVVDRE